MKGIFPSPFAGADSKGGVPVWAVTFADMMTLILSFFVLLYSFSNLEAEKFKAIAGSLRQAFGLQGQAPAAAVPLARGTPVREQQQLDLVAQLRQATEQAGLGERGAAVVTYRGVALRLEGEALFDSGSAELKPQVLPLLARIAKIAVSSPGLLEVEGHTDDIPISNARFPSNWELSSARAGSVVRYLQSCGVAASRMRAVGYADSRPLAPNTVQENRARNRRVEFLFVDPDEAPRPAGPGRVPSNGASQVSGR